MRNKSLGFKLIAGGVLAVTLPIVIIGVFSVSKAFNALDHLGQEEAVSIAKKPRGYD